MLPFCGYHMGDYFAHWLDMGQKGGATGPGEWGTLPRIFFLNWFRKTADGTYLWPGFGENSRVLKWVFERCDGQGETSESFIGFHPADGTLDVSGLDLPPGELRELFKVDAAEWRKEVTLLHDHYAQFGDRLPSSLRQQLEELETRVRALK